MSDMFCFQCQQTAGNKCCVSVGVCGKQPDTAALQDELVYELIRLAEAAAAAGQRTQIADRLLMDGLFITLTNVNFDNQAIAEFTERVRAEREKFGGKPCAVVELWKGDTDTVSLRSTLLFGMKGMAAYAHHAMNLGYTDDEVSAWFYKGLCAVNRPHSVEEWLALIVEFGQVNFRCMELLDEANTGTFGTPQPAKVPTDIKKGPFIVVSGHDLGDLAQLLEQTAGKGINIYTHSEMLPAHGYPGLKKYPHLAGNFGTAWQSQQTEFENIPAPVLFTTNCLMPQRPSYQDRVYTTSVVGYAGLRHIEADACGRQGLLADHRAGAGARRLRSTTTACSGINGGHMLMTGFAHGAVLAARGGDHRRSSRAARCGISFWSAAATARTRAEITTPSLSNPTPMDTLVLTLACGKYRFNDLDLGRRSAGCRAFWTWASATTRTAPSRSRLRWRTRSAAAVNELPLSLVLSWYEQKAVCILLTLLCARREEHLPWTDAAGVSVGNRGQNTGGDLRSAPDHQSAAGLGCDFGKGINRRAFWTLRSVPCFPLVCLLQ